MIRYAIQGMESEIPGRVFGVLQHDQLQDMTCAAMKKLKPSRVTDEEWQVKLSLVLNSLGCDMCKEQFKSGMSWDTWRDWFVYVVASSDREVC